MEKYFNRVRPYLKDIMNNVKKFHKGKIQLAMENSFIFSIDNDEERVMHSKSDNIEIMISDKEDEVIKDFFKN